MLHHGKEGDMEYNIKPIEDTTGGKASQFFLYVIMFKFLP